MELRIVLYKFDSNSSFFIEFSNFVEGSAMTPSNM